MGACLLDHLPQALRILKHGAGPQMIAVEGLAFMILFKERALQDLKDGFIPDVGVREMDEYAGLRISVGIDVEVISSACNAAAHVLAVILEVHRIERYV